MRKDGFPIMYKSAFAHIKDKDVAIRDYINAMLSRTARMFQWKNLPETIPQRNLELILQKNGHGFLTEIDGKLYLLIGTMGGELNVYFEPTTYVVANPYLNLTKEYDIEKDGVLIRNDTTMQGLLPCLMKHGVMLADCELSLDMIAVLMRACYLITAPDDKSKQSADIFIQKLVAGDFSVIGESAFFDGIKMLNAGTSARPITEIMELTQYVKASAYHDIGLNANYNMKRERLSANEVELNNDSLIPFAQDMLRCRLEAVEKINERYGLDISVDLAGVWKAESEQVENAISESDTPEMQGGAESKQVENAISETEGVKE